MIIKDNNFLELLNYIEAPELELKNTSDICDEIDFYLQNANDKSLDLINYERLIYLDAIINDHNCGDARKLLDILKEKIINTYILKTKMKYRYLYEDSIYYNNIIDKNVKIMPTLLRE